LYLWSTLKRCLLHTTVEGKYTCLLVKQSLLSYYFKLLLRCCKICITNVMRNSTHFAITIPKIESKKSAKWAPFESGSYIYKCNLWETFRV
jgi:hypothetical protein